MIGTLIGIFITTAGIVVGADSALWDFDKPARIPATKICEANSQQVATIQGWYGEQLYLNSHFLKTCEKFHRSSEQMSIQAQVDKLTKELAAQYKEHVGQSPPANFKPPLHSLNSNHVIYVSISGYERGIPRTMVKEILWNHTSKGEWELVTTRSLLSFNGCGAKFHGHDKVANFLLQRTLSPFSSRDKYKKPEVVAGRHANLMGETNDCPAASFTIEEAKALYKTAMRASMTYGPKIDSAVREGIIGGTLRLFIISPNGTNKMETVNPTDY